MTGNDFVTFVLPTPLPVLMGNIISPGILTEYRSAVDEDVLRIAKEKLSVSVRLPR